ncbi:CAZyme family GH15 and CBM20 [Agaricus bisporus var. burnettii]|uniref:Glucoamylase n=1 Tax=Agaricus bisporus var. burnettii TaxID=192524 RepID=A0A8H7KJQ2_AGABI|nr:CAZyme family GH15 and CBM20 [Agaricus bisporus var. burnettii]
MRISSAFLWTSLALSWGTYAQSSSVDAYLAAESPIAKAGLLANIGPSGSKSAGAKAGIVIASPSHSDPDYLFTWTRDASLVFAVIIDQYTLGLDTSLRSHIDNFVSSQKIIQQVSNPSGTISTGGLGEPKFNIDETAFTGSWGRPQRDGPALRANALITWSNHLLKQNNASYVTSTLWPIIKLDLDYIKNTWNQSSFDLWEEVSSSSFFTTAVQHRSLRQGAALANAIRETSVVADYTKQADNLLCFMQSYWNTGGYMTANTGGGRTGKDANTVLASIHTFDAAAGCDAATFQPCSDRALANLVAYVNAFRSIYAINSGVPSNVGIATGRYAEDVYFGGNPWYLTTLAVAEQLYDALIVWKNQGSITVTNLSKPFFSLFSSGISTGTFSSSSSTFNTLITGVQNYADSFVNVVAKHTPSGGGLAEQYSRNDGNPLSAFDLTWSYASLLTADGARNGVVPASWGAKGLTVPGTCSGNSGPTAHVTFNVNAETVFGENIFVTGSVGALANWSPDNAIALNADNYPIWSVAIDIPASTNVEYKYIRKFNGGVTWESDPNRRFTSPASGSSTLNDVWR